jgi:hypothetical protein
MPNSQIRAACTKPCLMISTHLISTSAHITHHACVKKNSVGFCARRGGGDVGMSQC